MNWFIIENFEKMHLFVKYFPKGNYILSIENANQANIKKRMNIKSMRSGNRKSKYVGKLKLINACSHPKRNSMLTSINSRINKM